jgi:hypothetical protein
VHPEDMRMTPGRTTALSCVLIMAGLCGCSAGSSAPAATTPTTSTTSAALDAAREACRQGDTTSANTTAAIQRIALGLTGVSTIGLSNEAVDERWVRFLQQPGNIDTSDLNRRAAAQVYGGAAAAAARAAALDPRWGDLHRGLSAYAAFWVNRSRPSDAESKGWFEDIRLGCERARAAGP